MRDDLRGYVVDHPGRVYLVYAAERGHAFIDRALYLPRSWTGDPERCRAARVPDQAGFATKPRQAAQLA